MAHRVPVAPLSGNILATVTNFEISIYLFYGPSQRSVWGDSITFSWVRNTQIGSRTTVSFELVLQRYIGLRWHRCLLNPDRSRRLRKNLNYLTSWDIYTLWQPRLLALDSCARIVFNSGLYRSVVDRHADVGSLVKHLYTAHSRYRCRSDFRSLLLSADIQVSQAFVSTL